MPSQKMIYDSMIRRNFFKKNYCMMMMHFIPCHINLGLHVSMSQFKIKIYLVQHVTIQND
jgi:hypothetical protein